MSLSNNNYSYIHGSGHNTSDCGIISLTEANPLPNTSQCLGRKNNLLIKPDYFAEDLKWELEPTYHLNEIFHWYHCQFNTTVDFCSWESNGTSIDISSYKYEYANKNGELTFDCSIKGHEEANPLHGTITCIGRCKKVLITAAINETIVLPCKTRSVIDCIWNRNVPAGGSPSQPYEYLGYHRGYNTTDCSIIIKNVKKFGEGEWICMMKTDKNSPLEVITIYHLNVENYSVPYEEIIVSTNIYVTPLTQNYVTALKIGFGASFSMSIFLCIFFFWHNIERKKDKAKKTSYGHFLPMLQSCSDYDQPTIKNHKFHNYTKHLSAKSVGDYDINRISELSDCLPSTSTADPGRYTLKTITTKL
ncbi:hypothetical protein CHUAL_001849 [Chamberlinius hualienensis]